MRDPELAREIARWLRYAKEELDIADLILKNGQVARAACFNAQQSAEKAIKGSLIFLQIEYPKTHDLNRLRELLPQGGA